MLLKQHSLSLHKKKPRYSHRLCRKACCPSPCPSSVFHPSPVPVSVALRYNESRTNNTPSESPTKSPAYTPFISLPPPSPPSNFSALTILALSSPDLLTLPSAIHKLAPTNFAYASVEKDLGRSIGIPTARSIINCGRTPIARETPNNTV